MKFPFITVKEATLRRWIGAGRKLKFQRDAQAGFFQIRLIEDVSPASFYHLHSAYGPIELTDAPAFLQMIADLPAFPDLVNQPEAWFIELVNTRLTPEFKTLFRFFTENQSVETEMLSVEITVQKADNTAVFFARLPFTLLDIWMSERGFDALAIPFPVALPLTLPFVIGQFTLSAERVLNLNPGDVVIPTDPFMDVDGQGVLMFGNTEFYFELEPETDNSNQYQIHLTRKQGSDTMNEHENDETALVGETEGELLQESSSPTFSDLPLELTIRCGNLSMTLGELQNLDTGSTLLVDHVTPGEALLCHGNYLLAKGELVNVNGALGLQIKSMIRAIPG